MSIESQHQHDSPDTYPPELSPFGADRIAHDHTWYGHFIDEGAFFYDAFDEHVYTITSVRTPHTFALRSCDHIGATPPEHPVANSLNCINNVCDLAGAYELGDITPLEQGDLQIIDETALLNVGEFVLRFPSEDAASHLRDWLDLDDADRIDIGAIRSRVQARTVDVSTDNTHITVYHSSAVTEAPLAPARSPSKRVYRSETLDIQTRFVPVQQFSKWTFDDPSMKKWVEEHLEGTVLNVCAGKNHLNHDDTVIRNDINPDRPADLHVDAAELAIHLDAESIDTIVFDPPWSLYQSNLRYEGAHVTKGENTRIDTEALPFDIPNAREKTQLGHARLAKEGFDYLLKPGGKVLQLTFHGTCMPCRLGYKRLERVLFDPVGEAKTVIGSVDQKTQNSLNAYV